MFEIIGREEELASLYAFIDDAEARAAALVLEGEAGIGKSTLWFAGVEHARAQGLRVLSSRPAEAERGLAHAGLGDLFEGVLDDVLPALAPPRRRALEVALLLEEVSGDPVDHRAVAVAVRSVLQLLSEREPILIAVDDVQWLDAVLVERACVRPAKARREPRAPAPCPAARRRSARRRSSSKRLVRSASGGWRVGPLSVGALHRFLLDRLGRPFARQTLLRIHETVGRESVLRAGAGPRS